MRFKNKYSRIREKKSGGNTKAGGTFKQARVEENDD